MKIISLITLLLIFCLSVPTPLSAQSSPVKAFPGAEGFGANTKGGRGGTVMEVTTLADSGTGSLRACIEASGPRICVFRVGGEIKTAKAMTISNPFITIAGQTAPGDGITIRGVPFAIQASEVIIRGIRIRVGDETTNFAAPDGLRILSSQAPIKNIILDHVSVSWAIDENASIYYLTANTIPVTDVTIQWSIIGEALHNTRHPEGGHSNGLLIGDNSMRISAHHNLFAHQWRRNPVIKGAPHNITTAEIINNVAYNWWERATHFIVGYSRSHIIGNYYKPGTNSGSIKGIHIESSLTDVKTYVKDNIGPGRTTDTQPDWNAVTGNSSFQSTTPLFSPSGITTSSAFDAYNAVLASAGAFTRDAAEVRLVEEVKNGTGRIIDSQSQVGGWPTLASGVAPVDTDHDGMPDSWESAHNLNPAGNDSAQDQNNDGYTNIEEYINSLAAPLTPTPSEAPSLSPSITPVCPQKPQGDADCNGIINLPDFEQWRKEFTRSASTLIADFNNDGAISIADYERWRSGYFITLPLSGP